MDRDSLRLLLAQGLSLEEIGRRYGKHPSTVGYWVQKHGLEANGPAKYAPKGGLTREQLEPLLAEGLTGRAIGVSLATVRHWLAKYELRTAGAELRANAAERRAFVERQCPRHGPRRFRWRGDGYRCPKCDSEAVSRRRRKVKLILVAEAGGCCQVCGYDRYPGALEFHHLDPSSKEFALSQRGVTIALERAREEAAKCMLLCANCHAEAEHGKLALPLGGA